MAAKIVSVCNQKGGCGKTTITMALAGVFASRKCRVLVIDGDPQGSASSWSANAPEDAPFPATVVNLAHAKDRLPREAQKMVNDYDVMILDCPPAVDSPVAQAALLISDVAVIPLIPSPLDVAAAVPFIRLVHQVQAIHSELNALIVPNLVDKNRKIADGYLGHFASLPLPVSDVRIYRRDVHKHACAFGTTVLQLADRQAATEAKALGAEIAKLWGEQDKTSRAVGL